jgi:preprotein translocase subunit SecE
MSRAAERRVPEGAVGEGGNIFELWASNPLSTSLYKATSRTIMASISPVEFLRQVRQEVGKVTWPTRRETLQTTAMVFLMVFLVGAFFFVVDLVLGHAVQYVLNLGA